MTTHADISAADHKIEPLCNVTLQAGDDFTYLTTYELKDNMLADVNCPVCIRIARKYQQGITLEAARTETFDEIDRFMDA